MEDKNLLGRRLVKWGCRAMPNYRESGPSAEFQPWPGFDEYMKVLIETDTLPSAFIRRDCSDGNERRSVYYDEAIRP